MGEKITKSEFQKWAQQVKGLTLDLIETGLNQTYADAIIQVSSLTRVYIKEGVLPAVFTAMLGFEAIGIKNDNPLNVLDGLTFLEWKKQVFTRMKEHCIANGYWNPNNPPNLTLLKERRKKVWKNYFPRILNYANSEEYQTLTNLEAFADELKKMIPDEDKNQENDDIPAQVAFIVEDYVGLAEKLNAKLEQAEKSNQPNSPPPPKSPTYKNNLANEINNLRNQVKELEDKINSPSQAVNQTEKDTYREMLEYIKERLKNKEKEMQEQDQQQNQPASNDKLLLGLMIGGGVIITFLLLIILILLASRRSKRD